MCSIQGKDSLQTNMPYISCVVCNVVFHLFCFVAHTHTHANTRASSPLRHLAARRCLVHQATTTELNQTWKMNVIKLID